jgi:alpha-galactosidase
MPPRIAMIGAGSIGFTRKLVQDILTVPELSEAEFAFTDINKKNLEMVRQLTARDIRANGKPAKLTATTNRRRALEGADYVFSTVRVGGLDAFQFDIDIPLKYGIDQCVGDTLCAGGIMYGQRNIPQILAFCADIAEVATDDCMFINYANPMAMNTWAALDYGWPNTVGLCHGVEGGWAQIDAALARLHGDEQIPWHQHARREQRTHVVCAGINHQTWYIKVLYQGWPVGSEEMLRAFETHPTYRRTEKVRLDMIRRFGCYTTESNGHCSEYVPWYRKRPKEIGKWIDLSSWINGETGGYLRVCIEGRNWFETDFPKWLSEAGKPITKEERSSEHGSWIIESIETGRFYRGHFNVRNQGCITNLPDDCIVEVPAFVDKFGINVPQVGELPMACAATCDASVNVQRMSKEAAVHGDVTLLKQAMLHDPLVAAVCDPEEVWQLVDEMLVAQAQWLPQYRRNGAIAAAKKRLAAGKKARTRAWQGAARVKVKTVAELRRTKEASVLAADKAAAKRAKETGKGGKA